MNERLVQHQEMKQVQRLTPMQVQYVRMLEMNGPEVEAEVARALEDMPALEVADDRSVPETDTFEETAEQVQLADYGNRDDIPTYLLDARNRSADDAAYSHVAANDEMSLGEALESQLSELSLSPDVIEAAHYIIGNIDANGYLRRPLHLIADDIAIDTGNEIDGDAIREAFNAIRTLDPAGVGAEDLRDCLLLQLRRLPHGTPGRDLALKIAERYFDLFSRRRFEQLAERTGTDDGELREAMAVISRLNPKPGLQQGDTAIERAASRIVPEFQVDVDGDKVSVTLLNNIPELALSASFAADPDMPDASPRRKAEALTFVRTRRDEASSFIRTLAMRQQTLLAVMTAIAKLQSPFMASGDETDLRPMVLRDIAALTGYDLSVISRATSGKYVSTPSGTYPLKFFFNERPGEDDTTFHQIAAALRDVIDSEDKRSPLSDELIADALAKAGYNIARRTVAKYRERLGYPAARLRKNI